MQKNNKSLVTAMMRLLRSARNDSEASHCLPAVSPALLEEGICANISKTKD